MKNVKEQKKSSKLTTKLFNNNLKYNEFYGIKKI